MLLLQGVLEKTNDDNIIIKTETWFSQTVYFTKEKVKNKQGLEEILNTKIGDKVIIWVYAFAIGFKKQNKVNAFVKFILTGDIVK